ncbi:Transcriptional regulator, TetR family OS=Tsukamurella paurometabola (strain ATCC 8368 / DSM/ CCUG 35730 / CIP 100753 / JCM 10117 / KCTC 9821 / NBRC 16120/ NCIMB 702349 / NCTC 13040) OX=521096 GN=Tpau_2430 PE=4 SV=1 [Tsukamurella paurometabola]|uniref:Transcriptional regulator, TetR family n=1 Tax=Tsukamurella paurometabola (strain ATCC 8368 / DSM 20162 / CCUG 35730 / CIP 100753 / JCM 10117 / KCTC 9821 / NBRC 16120 / NCIMB 702349 / NCTC 13040) TaxID=521096 RepID=D5UR47_TSUPD|nr:TetR/AcrR family transcriptional regulator [Tsukamurella paurometabola]ADG79036.1 transcriptional regulator, TetR family [Tsukamurella paurometabola DSM 20162]SUP33842.1 Tetracyclin repressor, C-terminal all-alpha domain [Tsukamurella paurometabola]
MNPEDEGRALVRLLWRSEAGESARGRKGPKQRLTVDEVVASAVALADAEGLSAVTMRALAARLGIGPMSVYTYVPTRDVLVALMVDAVALAQPPAEPRSTVRESLIAVVRARRDEYLAHPWLLDAPSWRDVLGPGKIGQYEAQLALLEDLSISDLERDWLVVLLESFAAGAARSSGARGAASRPMTDAQWWEVVGPELAARIPPGKYPIAGRVGTVVGEHYSGPGDPDAGFELGLQVLLDGLESRIPGLSAR